MSDKKTERPMGEIHVYVDGVRIDKIEPRLKFLDLDDWLNPCLEWIVEKNPKFDMWARFTGDPHANPDSVHLKELWFGEPSPAMRDDDPSWMHCVRKGPVGRFLDAIKKMVM